MNDRNKRGPMNPINKTTAERIYQQRKAHREKQQDIADIIPVTSLTISRYENGKYGVPPDVVNILAKHWGIVPEYLTGESDTADPVKYFAELEEAADSGLASYFEEERAELARLENLFTKCGFNFEDVSHTAPFDFAPDADNAKPFRLSDKNGTVPATLLSSEDVRRILECLHDFIAYQCFCIANRKEDGHGNG